MTGQPLRMVFIYGPFSVGHRAFDFDALETSPRGLTGSERSCFWYAQHMAMRGHAVTLAVHGIGGAPRDWRGLRLVDLAQLPLDGWDVALSWNEPDMLRAFPRTTVRVLDQQLNDFTYCRPGWWEHVSLLASPSAPHLDFLTGLLPPEAVRSMAFAVLPNGCEPGDFARSDVQRIPGRVVWASSADRGLHLLLQEWPAIKRHVPHASLRCYYHWSYDGMLGYHRPQDSAPLPPASPDILEIAQRARYIRHAAQALAPLDVQHVGGVSCAALREAFLQGEVLAYPCQPIRYTEGFSVTSLEACAAGLVPVLTDVDALGEVYEGLPMIPSPAGQHMEAFVGLVVRALTDHEWAAEQRAKAAVVAGRNAWPVLAASLERVIEAWQEAKA